MDVTASSDMLSDFNVRHVKHATRPNTVLLHTKNLPNVQG